MVDPSSGETLGVILDRAATTPIAEQIFQSIRTAIVEARLEPGARLPSGRDLAVQLGVARGTVRAAYERLVDEGLIFSAGAAGTRVSMRLPDRPPADEDRYTRPLAGLIRSFSERPLPFEAGVPANDAFPAKVWARMRTRAVRDDALAPTSYADPRGEPRLRSQIAAHLAISRQLQCVADQVIVTGGYRNGLSLALSSLDAKGRSAWIEDPGFPIGRRGLQLAGVEIVPIGVDAQGLDVAEGVEKAPDALLALLTPGQQAPLGVALSEARRGALLAWASASDAWIVEDDYLSELQLDGRAAPALASGTGASRVIHVGTFSKTLSPALGLGFVVAPPALVDRMTEVAGMLCPAPNRTTQLAVAEFMADGHYLRHLRQMKRLYAERRDLLRSRLAAFDVRDGMAGMALLLELPSLVDDVALVARATALGIAPAPLSPWYVSPHRSRAGLLLSVTNVQPSTLERTCQALEALVAAVHEGAVRSA